MSELKFSQNEETGCVTIHGDIELSANFLVGIIALCADQLLNSDKELDFLSERGRKLFLQVKKELSSNSLN